MRLAGETTDAPKTEEREPINITPKAKKLLRSLLMEPEMRGVGFSEFITRAVRATAKEIDSERAGVKHPTSVGRYFAEQDASPQSPQET